MKQLHSYTITKHRRVNEQLQQISLASSDLDLGDADNLAVLFRHRNRTRLQFVWFDSEFTPTRRAIAKFW
jgi:hypothetical protein